MKDDNNKIDLDFSAWRSDGSKVELQFTENEDGMDVYKFRDFCVRFAVALTYTVDSIKAAFGEDIEI